MPSEQLRVDGRTTEFIDDDGGPRVLDQYAIQQSRLAAAQKAGQDEDGDFADDFGRGVHISRDEVSRNE